MSRRQSRKAPHGRKKATYRSGHLNQTRRGKSQSNESTNIDQCQQSGTPAEVYLKSLTARNKDPELDQKDLQKLDWIISFFGQANEARHHVTS